MVARYVVVVHNPRWGDSYKEFAKKDEAIKYRCECNFDMNTYAWLYKYVEVSEELEDQVMEKFEKKESEKVPSDPLKELENKLNDAHTEYLRAYHSNAPKQEVKEKRDVFVEFVREYEKEFKKSLKKVL